MANVSPVFKNGDRHTVTNYRPISLLSCIAKVQERIVFNVLYEYCVSNNLLTWRNSGFKKGDSVMNQMINITHQLNENLDNGDDTCMIFLDISKAFDRVWHMGIIHKLRVKGISGNLLAWFESYLIDRKQRVAINGQTSEYRDIHAGVPQGSILGPLLFLIFIDDLKDTIVSNIFLFADDTFLFERVDNDFDQTFHKLNLDLQSLFDWSKLWLVKFNPRKTEYMLISRKRKPINYPDLYLETIPIKKVATHKHLGVTFNSKGNWVDHLKVKISIEIITCY